MRKILLILIGLAFISSKGISQIIDIKYDNIRIDKELGLGRYYSFGHENEFSINLSLNSYKGRNFYRIRYLGHLSDSESSSDLINDFGVLIGKESYGKNLTISFSGGLGFLSGIDDDKNLNYYLSFSNKGNYITPSIPLEIDIYGKPKKIGIYEYPVRLRFGLTLFGNLNFMRPMYGFVIKVRIMNLKKSPALANDKL